MSWTFYNIVGRPEMVIAQCKVAAANTKCAEPEETIKAKCVDLIEHALSAYPANMPVKVNASGSQNTMDHPDGKATNSFSMTIEPLWGFLE